MSQMVSTKAVPSRTVTSPPSEERCSLFPYPGSGTCSETGMEDMGQHSPHPLQSPAERVFDPLEESY